MIMLQMRQHLERTSGHFRDGSGGAYLHIFLSALWKSMLDTNKSMSYNTHITKSAFFVLDKRKAGERVRNGRIRDNREYQADEREAE